MFTKYTKSEKSIIEQKFPQGCVVEVFGSDQDCIVVGNLRWLHPAWITNEPKMLWEDEEIIEVDKDCGAWFIDVKFKDGTVKVLNPCMLMSKIEESE